MRRKKVQQQVEMFAGPEPEAEPVQAARLVRGLTPQAERLLANFEVLAEAPGGVKKLRELVLSLAVRGRLVEQDPGDEPLLIGAPTAADAAFPPNWVCACVFDLLPLRSGNPFPSDRELTVGEYLYIKVSDMNLEENQHEITISTRSINPEANEKKLLIPANSIIFPKRGGAIATNKKRLVRQPIFIDSNTMAMTCPPLLDLHYIHIWFLGIDLWKLNSGTSVPQINNKDIGPLRVPLPPLAEQKRIVAKVDELMQLCDALEARQAKERETGARLTQAALDALAHAEGPEDLAASWQRVVGNFAGLISRVEDVKKVREVVLELAVRGQLVPQYAAQEGTGTALLNALEAGWVMEGRARKIVTSPEEYPFAIPANWCWTQWASLTAFTESGWSPQCENRPREGNEWGVLKVSAVSWDIFQPQENKALPPSLAPRQECIVKKGDYLMSRANTSDLVGRSVIVHEEPCRLLLSDKIVRCVFSNLVDIRFINYFNRSMTARNHYRQNASGTSDSMKNISREVILSMPIPLPPLAEQKRIVARVDELMRLCDDLETALRQAEDTSRKVAEALVAELLA